MKTMGIGKAGYKKRKRCRTCNINFDKDKIGKYCPCCKLQLKYTSRIPSTNGRTSFSQKLDLEITVQQK